MHYYDRGEMHLTLSSPLISGERGVDMHFHLLVVKT